MTSVQVERATADDADALATLLTAAYAQDPVHTWVFPDPAKHKKISRAYFRGYVDLALELGEIDVTPDRQAVALWLAIDPSIAHDAERAMVAKIREHVPDQERFDLVDQYLMGIHHYDESHLYAPFVAVAPDRQGKGLGTALVRSRLAELDEMGEPAYMEARSDRARKWQTKLGFADLGDAGTLPDGPTLYPMWRKPQS